MGVGISLEGTVKVVAGKEVQARHYIRAIAPDGALAKLEIFKVGDELLEVSIFIPSTNDLLNCILMLQSSQCHCFY